LLNNRSAFKFIFCFQRNEAAISCKIVCMKIDCVLLWDIMLISAFKSNNRVCKGMAGLRFCHLNFSIQDSSWCCATSSTQDTSLTAESNFLEQLIVSEPCVEELDADYFWGCVFQSALENTQHANLSLEKQRFPGIGSQQQAESEMNNGPRNYLLLGQSERASQYLERGAREKPTPPTLAVNSRETAWKFVLHHKQRENWFSKWVGHKSCRGFLYLLLSPGRRSEEGDKMYELSKQLLISNNTTDWDIIEVNKLPL
jgi:hypothetical protein